MLFLNVSFFIRKINLAGKLRVTTRLHSCVLAIVVVCGGSMWGHRQQLCLWYKQLLVEWRKQRVSREGIPLTEPVQLLHVQTAQRAQHRHPLVQLQEPQTHSAQQFKTLECTLYFIFLFQIGWGVPCASDFPGCLCVKCVWVPAPHFFAHVELCLCPPGMGGLQKENPTNNEKWLVKCFIFTSDFLKFDQSVKDLG